MNICLYGAASEKIDRSFINAVQELGRQMARNGHTMVFGGGKYGLMGAAARGMHEENGKIIGIAPKFFLPDGVLYENCTEFFYTENMRERKALMEEKADAFLVVPGGVGTYDELMEILTLITLGRTDKPLALFNINGYFDPLYRMLNHTAASGFMESEKLNCLFVGDSAETVFSYLEEHVKRGKK